jgi:hypothetical protein
VVADLDNEANKAFVEAFQAEYGRLPSLYASQGFDTANLILSAMAKADVSDKDAFRAALKAADFASVRGKFSLRHQQPPDPGHLRPRGGQGRRRADQQDRRRRLLRTTPTPTRPTARCRPTAPPPRENAPRARRPDGPRPRFTARTRGAYPRTAEQTALLIEQLLNGLQLGVMLFLMAAGLTLVFGVMGLINLAHGSLYMVGAFACAWVAAATGSFWLGLAASLAAAAAAGALVEIVVIRRLYDRDHLDQVLATFALILIFSEGTRWVFGSLPLYLDIPPLLRRGAAAGRRRYPLYRLAIIGVGSRWRSGSSADRAAPGSACASAPARATAR